MLEPSELPATVNLIDSATGNAIQIETKSCSESHKTLGVMESPNGNCSDETKRLTEKAIGFARKLSIIAVSRVEAKTLYFSMIQPSMLYSAPAGTLTRQDADRINSILTQGSLPSIGFNRNMDKRVVYGPRPSGGIGLRDLFVEQGAAKAAAILKHVQAGRELGRMIICQLQWAQRMAGTAGAILEETASRIPQLEGEAGLTTLREFLQNSDISIVIPEIKPPTPRRTWDSVIMTAAEAGGAPNLILNGQTNADCIFGSDSCRSGRGRGGSHPGRGI
jgi:hypothetical protein